MCHEQLTIEKVRDVLATRGGGVLRHGNHSAPRDDSAECEMCVRELTALACGLPWSDHPDGECASPTDRACQRLNDAAWSSDEARTEACLPLALLREQDARVGWIKRYTERTIREILPIALRAAAKVRPSYAEKLETAAVRCEQEGTREAAQHARQITYAAYAAYDAAYAAADAADAAAERDRDAKHAVTLLIECHRGESAQ